MDTEEGSDVFIPEEIKVHKRKKSVDDPFKLDTENEIINIQEPKRPDKKPRKQYDVNPYFIRTVKTAKKQARKSNLFMKI